MICVRLGLLVVLCGLAACGPKRPRGWGVQQVEWSEQTADAPSVAGLQQASVNLAMCDAKVAAAFWCDSARGSSEASWDKQRKAAHYRIGLPAPDDRPGEIDCFMPACGTGEVTIGGQKFQLENGRMFLIAATRSPIAVKQLDRDPASITWEIDKLKALAKSDAEIRDFFSPPAVK